MEQNTQSYSEFEWVLQEPVTKSQVIYSLYCFTETHIRLSMLFRFSCFFYFPATSFSKPTLPTTVASSLPLFTQPLASESTCFGRNHSACLRFL